MINFVNHKTAFYFRLLATDSVHAIIECIFFTQLTHTITKSFPYLRDTRQSNQIGDDTGNSDEDLLPPPEEFGPLVNDGGDEPFHGAELAVQTDEQ